MAEVKRSRLIRPPQLEDVPDLIHIIQSLLPVKEAARTCLLSKSWLHAWNTIPTLRFHQSVNLLSKRQERKYMKRIDRTLLRYLQNNIPIKSFDFHFGIHNHKSASLAEKWIRSLGSKSCLNVLYLTIWFGMNTFFTFPDEIFSGENLTTLSVIVNDSKNTYSLGISSNPVINCVSLRVLKLRGVHICEEVLNNLFSTCSLLEKIELFLPKGVKTIRVKNLRFLHELRITSIGGTDVLDIYDVPSLGSIFIFSSLTSRRNLPSFNTDSLGSVRELFLGHLIMEDDAFLDMIKLKLPFLECLSLEIHHCKLESFDITCVSLTRLTLAFRSENRPIDIQVYAPKLIFFRYIGMAMPGLLFPTIAPEQIEMRLNLMDHNHPIDHSFFVKMRKALNLSSKFNIQIFSKDFDIVVPLNLDVDDLRRSVLFPATNVYELSIGSRANEGLKNSPFLDAFFSICHPKYLILDKNNNYFWKLMARRMMKKKTTKEHWPHLKDVEIKNPVTRKWETLRSSWIGFLDRFDCYFIKLRLNWCSP